MAVKKISVFGAGAWGTALAFVLARNGHDVVLWGREEDLKKHYNHDERHSALFVEHKFPNNLDVTSELEKAAKHSKDYLIVVPSHAFKFLLNSLKPFIDFSSRLVWGTKGFDPETSHLLTEVAKDSLEQTIPVAVLSGPSFAKEVVEQQPTAVNIACLDDSFSKDLVDYFHCDIFRVYPHHDLVGVQVGGAVKNVMAIAVGISDGLGFGANTRCALITRGLAEIKRLGVTLGAEPETFLSLAGVGDLMLTCSDDQSRNRQFGLAVGKGIEIKEAEASINGVVEGYGNVEQVFELAKRHQVEMPITDEIYHVLYHARDPRQAVENLLNRDVVIANSNH